MFKKKTEQRRNDKRYNRTGITVKIHTNHDGVRANMIMLKSIAGRSSWRSPVFEVKPQKLHRPPFEWKNRSLLWYPFRCVEWKVTSVTAAEFCGAVIPSDLHVPVNSAVVHSKTLALNSLFSTLSCEKTRVFLWAMIRLKFTEHFTSRFCIRDKNFRQKCQIRLAELF